MRAVSLVNKIEFDFSGNLFKDALALGDVDNDKSNELAIGNSSGVLAVFKEDNPVPWRTCSNLGMITSVTVGDIFNEGKNSLVVISGEGWCNVIDVKSDNSQEKESPVSGEISDRCLWPCYTQRIMANTKVALLEDVDNDGAVELVIGLTDRVVRTYRWTLVTPAAELSRSTGKLVAIYKWEFASQIGRVCTHTNEDGTPCLLVAQPGGAFMKLQCYSADVDGTNQDEAKEALSKMSPEYHPLTSTKMRSPNVSSEILGNISAGEGSKLRPYAVATLDGTLMLINGVEMLWSLQVDHQLFALTKLDITGDGQDEIIACSWDGQTYIVNLKQESVRFHFEETVSTFEAGSYAVEPGKNIPCLVYVTFNNKIHLYYDIRLPQLQTTSLLRAMDTLPDLAQNLKALHVDVTDEKRVRQLYRWLLYGMPTVTALNEIKENCFQTT